jgi:hypothetical protein
MIRIIFIASMVLAGSSTFAQRLTPKAVLDQPILDILSLGTETDQFLFLVRSHLPERQGLAVRVRDVVRLRDYKVLRSLSPPKKNYFLQILKNLNLRLGVTDEEMAIYEQQGALPSKALPGTWIENLSGLNTQTVLNLRKKEISTVRELANIVFSPTRYKELRTTPKSINIIRQVLRDNGYDSCGGSLRN